MIFNHKDLEQAVELICSRGYKRIALQFPDHLLSHAVDVTFFLQENIPEDCEIFTLADTTYASCCVDEVAAEHGSTDFVLHFGPACMSPTSRLPVLYIWEQPAVPLDINDCAESLHDELKINNQENSHTVLFSDFQYQDALEELCQAFKKLGLKNTHCSSIENRFFEPGTQPSLDSDYLYAGRTLKSTCKSDFNSDSIILWIGSDDCPFLKSLTINFGCTVYTYHPDEALLKKSDLPVNRMLTKRFLMMEKTKEAETIGILVGTLSVAHYAVFIDLIREIIHKSGKKSHTFVVGKPNPAKLGNFLEVDLFVLISCPESALMDSTEYYKPIVTPYELMMALDSMRFWLDQSRYITDFQELLPWLREMSERDDLQSDEPHYSMASGRFIYSKKLQENSSKVESNKESSDALISVSGSKELTSWQLPEYLGERSWRGLDVTEGSKPVELATEGRKGIARNYSHEIRYE